jgi:5-(carboxyamino)imidazole ribonucleotide synthase
VHKIGQGGYDGKGVQVLNRAADMDSSFDAPAVLEKKVAIDKEIAIIIAVSNTGRDRTVPAG